jgi:hypothetical protein
VTIGKASHPQTPPDAPRDDVDPEDERIDRQTSTKTGTKSFSQKENGAKHVDPPAPPSEKVAGASGKER